MLLGRLSLLASYSRLLVVLRWWLLSIRVLRQGITKIVKGSKVVRLMHYYTKQCLNLR